MKLLAPLARFLAAVTRYSIALAAALMLLAPIAGGLMAVFGLERALRPGGALPADEAEIA